MRLTPVDRAILYGLMDTHGPTCHVQFFGAFTPSINPVVKKSALRRRLEWLEKVGYVRRLFVGSEITPPLCGYKITDNGYSLISRIAKTKCDIYRT